MSPQRRFAQPRSRGRETEKKQTVMTVTVAPVAGSHVRGSVTGTFEKTTRRVEVTGRSLVVSIPEGAAMRERFSAVRILASQGARMPPVGGKAWDTCGRHRFVD